MAAQGWNTWALDARGHGESDWAPDGDYQLSSFADDVGRFIATLDERPVLVGASLGGLTSMLLLGRDAPGVSAGLVIVDVVPHLHQPGADRIQSFMTDKMDAGFASLEEAADAVAAYNHHRTKPPDPAGLRKNLRQREDGRWYWHWDPAFMSPAMGKGPTEISDSDLLLDCCQAIDEPLLLVRGRMSDVVSEDGARRFLDAVPNAGFADVSGAGHMVAGDRNDAFTTVIGDFLGAIG